MGFLIAIRIICFSFSNRNKQPKCHLYIIFPQGFCCLRPRIVLQTIPTSSSVKLFPIASNKISLPFLSLLRTVANLVFILQTSSYSGVDHEADHGADVLDQHCTWAIERS